MTIQLIYGLVAFESAQLVDSFVLPHLSHLRHLRILSFGLRLIDRSFFFSACVNVR